MYILVVNTCISTKYIEEHVQILYSPLIATYLFLSLEYHSSNYMNSQFNSTSIMKNMFTFLHQIHTTSITIHWFNCVCVRYNPIFH